MSQPPTPTAESYFTGSDRVLDYFIDLDVDAEQLVDREALADSRQPLDVQAYLECIAIELRHQESPKDPKWDWNEMTRGVVVVKPYVPRLELVSQGLDTLREAAKTKEHGLWMDPSEVTDEDMACSDLGHIPWLASLIRTSQLEQATSKVEYFTKEPFSWRAAAYGNVRIPFPNGLLGPDHGRWLHGTNQLYGRDHPVILTAHYPPNDILRQMRFALWSVRVRHRPEPVLPLEPAEQEWFDEDPEEWFKAVCRDWDTGAPMRPDPVGFLEWQQERNKRIERFRKEEKERARSRALRAPSSSAAAHGEEDN